MASEADWHSGIFGCCDDMKSCKYKQFYSLKNIYLFITLFTPLFHIIKLLNNTSTTFYFFSGCYLFWCCPCVACTVSEDFGQGRYLPLCDICATTVSGIGIPLCVPPAVLALRVGIRQKYNIKVKHEHMMLVLLFDQQRKNTCLMFCNRMSEVKHHILSVFPQGTLCNDITTSCVCVWCSWYQLHQELKHRKKTGGVVSNQPARQ